MQPDQRAASRLIASAGQLLLAHGAESAVVGDIMRRIGLACRMDEVEVSLSASSIVVTTIYQQECLTTARRSPDKGINMRVVTQVQRICILLEKQLYDCEKAQQALENITPERYNRWLVTFMIGLSCAAFSRLSGGNELVFVMTFIASSLGMAVRLQLAQYHFNPFLNFTVCAFVTTVISAQAVVFSIGNQPTIAMASSVLMLVPGFPLINSVADMLKGYTNMGVARFVMATLLTLATSLGIVAAMTVVDVWGWVI